MSQDKTKEPQYQRQIELRDSMGLTPLGLSTSQVWHDDPRRLLFVLARYKFVAKMLSGKKRALEIGCGDAFGTRIVLQEVESICAVDFDHVFVADVKERMEDRWKFECKVHDILSGPVEGSFDAAYSLDVLEHIPKEREQAFADNVARSLDDDGTLIIGTPSAQSQAYAAPASLEGHVNLKDHAQLKEFMLKYFHNVMIFSMNDEVVHTGFYPMAHYFFALCAHKK